MGAETTATCAEGATGMEEKMCELLDIVTAASGFGIVLTLWNCMKDMNQAVSMLRIAMIWLLLVFIALMWRCHDGNT